MIKIKKSFTSLLFLLFIIIFSNISTVTVEAHNNACNIIAPDKAMIDLTNTGPYWSSGGSWESWKSWYINKGYTISGSSKTTLLWGGQSFEAWWLGVKDKNGKERWCLLCNKFAGSSDYFTRYNAWMPVQEGNEIVWYYLDTEGLTYTNTWLHVRDHDGYFQASDIHGYFYFDGTGRMCTGWHQANDGHWYYLKIDTNQGEDGSSMRTGMSEHGGLLWQTVKNPTSYEADGLYSDGLYYFDGLNVVTNVYRKNTSGTYDYIGNQINKIEAGDNDNQIRPFKEKVINADTNYVNKQIYNSDGLFINTDVDGSYTSQQNVYLKNDDYQQIKVNEYTYYIDRNKFTLTQDINSDSETSKTNDLYFEETQTINTPTKTGYTFDGWNLSGKDSTLDDTTFTMGTENAVLTAKWTPNTYTIVFDGNRNSSGSTKSLIYTWNDTDNAKKILTANGYVRDGWQYVNWNTKVNSSGKSYNNNQAIGNQFFIDNLGADALLDGKSHTVTLYATWKDIVTPKIKSVKVEQETLLSQVNKGAISLSTQNAYDGELYTNMTVNVDENNANNDASGIKNVSVYVYDRDNPSVNKTYDITDNKSNVVNTKYDFAYDNKYNPYSGTYSFKQNLYKDFPDAAKLGIYVYVTDYQGNTTKTTARWNKVINDTSTKKDIPQDTTININDNKNTIEDIVFDEINACIYSQYVTAEGSKDFGAGETGITTTWTYGYVESYSLDYLEINAEMDREINDMLLDADNHMNRSKNIDSTKLSVVDRQSVRIPPYVLNNLSSASNTKHEDGTVKYKDMLNNKYIATGYKGTAETGIYNIYNIIDTEYQKVHYRTGV